MERQFKPVGGTVFFQLFFHNFGRDSYAHAGNFDCGIDAVQPEEYVAVQRPVVVVGRASVVFNAAFQFPADLHNADGAVLASDDLFPFGRSLIGI